MHGDEWLASLSKKMKDDVSKGAAPAPHRLTIRELLDRYGYARRGVWIVSHVRNRLEELDLRTVPDFEFGWIDSTISVELAPGDGDVQSSGAATDPTHRIGVLDAANKPPVTVGPDDPLSVATTAMHLYDFSQLPVMQGKRTVKGIISWKSIGTRVSLDCDCNLVRQCMDHPSEEVSIRTPLFEAISTIGKHGYVLVRGEDNSITGIVTASDVSHQFIQLASPFLLIGEIEGHLRRLIHGKFTVEELRGAAPDHQGESIAGSVDLTFGVFCRLLENPDRWGRLSLNIDRQAFVKHLDSVRELRNDVMHFDPDGLSQEETKKLQDLVRFFRDLARIGVV